MEDQWLTSRMLRPLFIQSMGVSELLAANSYLLHLEMKPMRAVRVNQNSKVVSQKTNCDLKEAISAPEN